MQNNTMEEKIRKQNFRVMPNPRIFAQPIITEVQSERMKTPEEELIKFIQDEIHLAEQSLVQRVRDDITEMYADDLPSDDIWNEVENGRMLGYLNVLNLPILLTPKPKGDE